MKKSISIITYSKKHMESVIQQLENLLGNEFELRGYSIQEGIKEVVSDTLVLIGHEYLKDEATNYISNDSDILVARRSLNHSELENILQIPKGEKVLFVDVNKYLAENSVSLLEDLGINHIEMYPYFPNIDYSPHADYAITTGETHLVPDNVTNIIDIGYSKIDLTTITEIMLKFDIMDIRAKKLSSKYIQDFVYSSKKVVRTLKENNNIMKQLNTILDVINDGIIGLDRNCNIMFSNENAKKLFNSNDDSNINLNIISDLDIKSVCGNNFDKYRKIHEIKGKKILLTMMPIKQSDSDNGIVITFKDLSEIVEMENIVRSNLLKKGHIAKYKFKDIIGKSEIIKETINISQKLAKSDSTLLLTGESGTGKELFAQAIHNESRKHNGPFVAVNFAALPEDLLESELFGYEEGSFTGAKKGGHTGLFEQAHNGTIFLDEIGDASLKIQARLLRVLQEREVLKIGATKIIPIDIRIIAATNKKLDELVERGEFREDLYYRLKVLPIDIPPLRARKEDIPYLIEEIMRKFPKGKGMKLSKELENALMSYNWPGNIRELENVLEYMYNIAENNFIELKNLPSYIDNISKEKEEYCSEIENNKDKIELEIPLEDACVILDVLKKEKMEGNIYTSRKRLAKLLRETHLTEQMIRRRLDILSDLNLVVKERGPKGTRISSQGEIFIDTINIV
ncbi:MAG: sigma 54-interacting transcriptional regulator [Tissierellaceae bacterium]|nr:sigma 54-interacting transcriptional regulator [Tissierellaceae bacterium]